MEDLTDNESEELLRRWWSENWLWLVGGIVIGLGGLAGWQYWQKSRLQSAEQDEAAYTQPLMVEQINAHPSVRELYEEQLIEEALARRAGQLLALQHEAIAHRLVYQPVHEMRRHEISPRLIQAQIHWALQTAAGEPLYDFEAIYTLAHTAGAFHIAAIAHNEMPQYQACYARLKARRT